MRAKNPTLAAVLSAIWPGLGQVYTGRIALGLLFMGLTAALAAMHIHFLLSTAVATASQPQPAVVVPPWDPLASVAVPSWEPPLVLALTSLWVAGIYGAYRGAERFNRKQLSR
jgi:hypothetical protein